MAESTPELKTYHGNCHCGAFKFSIKIPELTSVFECSCSVCLKAGYKWTFPGAGCFLVEKGESALKDYEFGSRTMAFKFCPTCGTNVLGKRHGAPAGKDIAVNVRTLRDVDLWSLKVDKYDGAALKPAYIPPPYSGPEPAVDIPNAKMYTGACHCGAVTLALKAKGPLPEGKEEMQECNCSICARNGTILIYPLKNQVAIAGTPSLTSYVFGRKMQSHEFCSVCGIPVWLRKLPVSPEEFRRWEGEGEDQRAWEQQVAVNLRCFEGVEWEAINVEKGYWKDAEPKYEV